MLAHLPCYAQCCRDSQLKVCMLPHAGTPVVYRAALCIPPFTSYICHMCILSLLTWVSCHTLHLLYDK